MKVPNAGDRYKLGWFLTTFMKLRPAATAMMSAGLSLVLVVFIVASTSFQTGKEA